MCVVLIFFGGNSLMCQFKRDRSKLAIATPPHYVCHRQQPSFGATAYTAAAAAGYYTCTREGIIQHLLPLLLLDWFSKSNDFTRSLLLWMLFVLWQWRQSIVKNLPKVFSLSWRLCSYIHHRSLPWYLNLTHATYTWHPFLILVLLLHDVIWYMSEGYFYENSVQS